MIETDGFIPQRMPSYIIVSYALKITEGLPIPVEAYRQPKNMKITEGEKHEWKGIPMNRQTS